MLPRRRSEKRFLVSRSFQLPAVVKYIIPIHSISLPLQAQTQEIVRAGLPGQLFARHHSRTLSSGSWSGVRLGNYILGYLT